MVTLCKTRKVHFRLLGSIGFHVKAKNELLIKLVGVMMKGCEYLLYKKGVL